ncbi:MAG: hypothetical protein AB8B46_03290 [Candidatus Midichloriaceae bacterium]
MVKVGVLQYNVKGDSRDSHDKGVWSRIERREKQVDAIKEVIKNKGVDFVAMQQVEPGEDKNTLDYYLNNQNSDKEWKTLQPDPDSYWNTVKKEFDIAQITFNQKAWGLIKDPIAGFWKGNGDDDVRPFVAGYFKNVWNPELKLLLVSVHFPHADPSKPDSCNAWVGVTKFKEMVNTLIDNSDLSKLQVIFAGDMNEIGNNSLNLDNPTQINKCLEEFGEFNFTKYSVGQYGEGTGTCCSNSKYIYKYDHIVAKGEMVDQGILPNTGYISGNIPSSTEEHKALYAVVELSDSQAEVHSHEEL